MRKSKQTPLPTPSRVQGPDCARHDAAKTNSQFAITVEDDGQGFDTAILSNSKGIGWSSIQNRVDFLKGNLDEQSEPGKGTSVQIDLPV